MDLSVKFVDDDHVWINNKQYISLKRFQHKIMETREAADTVPSVDAVEVVRCKDCIYFELDHWVNINGQPLIIAHEICAAAGGGRKTKPDGYCNMGERKTNGNNTL